MGFPHLSFVAFALGLVASGCTTHGIHQARTNVSEHGITAISYPENHRVAFLKKNHDIEHLCAGPGIDVASSSVGGFSLGLSGGPVAGDKVGNTRETVETSLGGRDASVLLAREILFRTCEAAMNHEFPPEQALSLLRDALKTIQAIAAAHDDVGTDATQGPEFIKPAD